MALLVTAPGDGKFNFQGDFCSQLTRGRIFIIEGCITILVSLACLPVVPPFPEKCNFLTLEDKGLMLARVKADGGHVYDDDISFKKALSYLKDWKIWTG
jgi:hypothetical protein